MLLVNHVEQELLLQNYMNQLKRIRNIICIILDYYLTNDRTEWSSFDEKIPYVIAQTYLFEHPISALSTTTTRHGITSRDLLIATPNQLISIPKRVLDPRRPVIPKNGKLKPDQKEEGLMPYEPLIPDERKW